MVVVRLDIIFLKYHVNRVKVCFFPFNSIDYSHRDYLAFFRRNALQPLVNHLVFSIDMLFIESV